MSLIRIEDLSFSYDSGVRPVFEHLNFSIDTSWKLGFIGRNGRGKTTLCRLLCGAYEYTGSIIRSVRCDYFPFPAPEGDGAVRAVVRRMVAPFDVWEREMDVLLRTGTQETLETYGALQERYQQADGYIIDELLEREAQKLGVDASVFARPFSTLSSGERTKLMLAALFLRKNNYLLIDEPTNHLDREGREAVSAYLSGKEGFLLISHDRDFLDGCIDHVLSLNRADVEIQRGNFSTWQANREKRDQFELDEHEKLSREVGRLALAAARTAGWSERIERSKIGEHAADRGFIGHKSAKMMKRAKAVEQRREKALEEKASLLQNLERSEPLKMTVLESPRRLLVEARKLSLSYGERILFEDVGFTVETGDRVALTGSNGCGKSSLLKSVLGEEISKRGELRVGGGLRLSYVPQDTSFLRGGLKAFAQERELDESLFKTILRKLGFAREQFALPMEGFSAGQKKKALLAASLCTPAHLYVWDEPLNYIDVLSRIQLEELLLACRPTLLFVEHDARFCRTVATKTVKL